jgi:hypothetical protein
LTSGGRHDNLQDKNLNGKRSIRSSNLPSGVKYRLLVKDRYQSHAFVMMLTNIVLLSSNILITAQQRLFPYDQLASFIRDL